MVQTQQSITQPVKNLCGLDWFDCTALLFFCGHSRHMADMCFTWLNHEDAVLRQTGTKG